MIEHTFILLPGIGEAAERRLWAAGILTWDDFLRAAEIPGISSHTKRFHDEQLRAAQAGLAARDTAVLARLLPRRDHWRLFPALRDHALALDIETNGLPPDCGGFVTVVGLYDGFDYRALVRGQTLSADRLRRELGSSCCLISFFGSVFDLPFVRATLGVEYAGAHVDLCFAARRAGLRGGLKRIERHLGIHRDDALQGLDGYDAVRLWHAARRGSREAMELLIAYNRCDTVHLFRIADALYGMLRARTGFEHIAAGARACRAS